MKFKTLSYFLALCMVISIGSCANSAETADTNGGIIYGGVGDKAAEGTFAGESYEGVDYAPSVEIGEAAAAPSDDYFEEGEFFESVSDSVSDRGGAEGDIAVEGDYSESYVDSDYVVTEQYIQPQAGLLTGGEWNDNKNFDFWTNLITDRYDWEYINHHWNFDTRNRIAVTVNENGTPVQNVDIKLISGNTVMWEAVTDNSGNAYLFKDFIYGNHQYTPTKIIAEYKGKTIAEMEYADGDSVELNVTSPQKQKTALDLMFVIDTTGSMSDELRYIQTELNDIVKRVAKNNQIDVRLSVNFYRDTQDEYTVRSYPFTENLSEAVNAINMQEANGGGDYEEAVEKALDDAVNNHDWNEDNIKLMFLVLDAPPHYSAKSELPQILYDAAAEGIRIIPVASSGVDTETEYLCRTFAIATGGTYTFLTDHSGVGGSHLEPTVGYYQVEKLNDMIVRIIESYL